MERAVSTISRLLLWAATYSYITGTVAWVCLPHNLPRAWISSPPTVPMDQTSIRTLYVFVEIAIDSAHLKQTIRLNFPNTRHKFHGSLLDAGQLSSSGSIGAQLHHTRHLQVECPEPGTEGASQPSNEIGAAPTRLALVSTVQFVASLQRLKEDLSVEAPNIEAIKPIGLLDGAPVHNRHSREAYSSAPIQPQFWTGKYDASIPRSKPLSPGEILGCTAPRLGDVDALLYISFLDMEHPH